MPRILLCHVNQKHRYTEKLVAQAGQDAATQMGEVLQMTKEIWGRAEN